MHTERKREIGRRWRGGGARRGLKKVEFKRNEGESKKVKVHYDDDDLQVFYDGLIDRSVKIKSSRSEREIYRWDYFTLFLKTDQAHEETDHDLIIMESWATGITILAGGNRGVKATVANWFGIYFAKHISITIKSNWHKSIYMQMSICLWPVDTKIGRSITTTVQFQDDNCKKTYFPEDVASAIN